MRVAVSPYHLTTREPAAVTAFLLGSSVVTMLPTPLAGRERERAERVAAQVPRYLDFMESWRWTVPLWTAGILGAEWGGEAAADEVRTVCTMIAGDERYQPLRPLMRPELFETDERYLDAMAADMLKGGPDPCFSVPVAAGMDRFATRHGIAVVRSEPTSIVQKEEERLGQRLFAIAIPVLLQASGERFLTTREVLEPELIELRKLMAEIADLAESPNPNGHAAAAQKRLAEAARRYAAAFELHRNEIFAAPVDVEEDNLRVIEGMVVVTGMLLPPDAALTSSISAIRTILPSMGRIGGSPSNLPVALADNRRIFTLLVKVLGRSLSR
jgi:hypothetical protein